MQVRESDSTGCAQCVGEHKFSDTCEVEAVLVCEKFFVFISNLRSKKPTGFFEFLGIYGYISRIPIS